VQQCAGPAYNVVYVFCCGAVIPRSTIHDVVHRRMNLRAYKIQLVQKLRVNDKPSRHTFMQEILLRLDDDAFLKHTVFLVEATCHVSDRVNRHNCQTG
jgi:hypothetical protein